MEDVHINSNQAKHLQAYIEYHNIVGNADGGKLFTPEQYEEYKDNLKKNAKNRVYASWRNTKGMDCKTIGPSSMCFCGHRYKEHNSLNPINKKVKCQTMKCSCPCFSHVPVHGSSDLKCLCKTSYADHDPASKKCPKGKMGSPSGTFVSTWSCSCGQKFNDHVTVIETREERIALGKPVDSGMGEMGNLMGGGLSNFSAMVEGAESHAAQVDAYVHGRKNNMALPYNQQYALTGGSQRLGIEDGMSNLSLQSKHAGTVSLQGDVEGGISAYDLFNMPHQFAKPKYGGGMGTGTGLKKAIRY